MALNYFKDPSGLVDQYQSGEFEGFSLDVDDDRDFKDVLTEGRITGIDLYNKVSDRFTNSLPGFDGFIQGQEVGVFAQGNKLFETEITDSDIRFGGSRESISVDVPKKFKGARDVEEILPDLAENTPDELNSVRDLGRALGFSDGGTISFKPVKDDPVSNQSENVKDKVKEKVKSSNKNLGLILPVILGLTAFYYVVFR